MKKYTFTAGSSDWLDFRTGFITGTEVSSLFGLNKHKSATKVLLDKCNPPMKEDNAFLRSGRVLEPGVIILMNEMGIPAEPAGGFGEVIYITHDKEKIGSSMDAKMSTDKGFYIVECKTTQMKKLCTWLKTPPIGYLLQVQTQMLVSGIDKALLGCMSAEFVKVYHTTAIDFFLLVHEIKPSKRVQELITKEVKRFWKCAEKDEKFVVNKEYKAEIEELLSEVFTPIFADNRVKWE